MINMRKTVLAFALFGAAAAFAPAAPAEAQVYMRTMAPRGWLGITFQPVAQRANVERSYGVVITSVSEGSPAEKAGVQVGDTLVRLNDFRASAELLGSMGASVEPGDTVRIVVRRGNRDHDLAIEVAKRPATEFTAAFRTEPGVFTFDVDSVRGMVRLFADSMYANLDSTRMRMFHFDTTGIKGSFYIRDSIFSRLPSMMFDSVFSRLPSMAFDTMHMVPLHADSMMRYMPRIDLKANVFEFEGEHTPGVVFRSIVRSENAFAGADLTELNPDLGEYFGARGGVLVLRVPPGTPAARAGLEPGDIVNKVSGTNVTSMADLRRAVETVKRGEPIKLEIVRHKKPYSLELKRD